MRYTYLFTVIVGLVCLTSGTAREHRGAGAGGTAHQGAHAAGAGATRGAAGAVTHGNVGATGIRGTGGAVGSANRTVVGATGAGTSSITVGASQGVVGGSGTGGTAVAVGSANRTVVGATRARTTGMAGQSAMAVLRQLAIEEPERLELRSPSIGNGRAGFDSCRT